MIVALMLGLALTLVTPSVTSAQVTGDTGRTAGTTADSARRAAGDTSVGRLPGAAPLPGAPADSGAPSADRVPSASDQEPAGPGAVRSGTAPLPINVGVDAPEDTTLARACAGTPAGDEAPGLLAVAFRPGTSDRDRIAAAKAVGGSLAGTSAYGEDYVRLGVGEGPLTAVADRLIRQDPVVRVSPAPCPAPPPAPPASSTTPAPADSASAGQTPAGQTPAQSPGQSSP
jgi:hypothetical protein